MKANSKNRDISVILTMEISSTVPFDVTVDEYLEELLRVYDKGKKLYGVNVGVVGTNIEHVETEIEE